MNQHKAEEFYLFDQDLILAQQLIYEPCNFTSSSIKPETESQEYKACSFSLNGKKIIYRASKITPTKTGQFVTIWKRDDTGVTAPYNEKDDFDFLIISCRKDNGLGQFIFPKSALVKQGIITSQQRSGKRGVRVYPPWDTTSSKQALGTQKWQINYFVNILPDNINMVENVKNLLK
ncbi:MAG: MepB family protein [Bacteroidota bacterium]